MLHRFEVSFSVRQKSHTIFTAQKPTLTPREENFQSADVWDPGGLRKLISAGVSHICLTGLQGQFEPPPWPFRLKSRSEACCLCRSSAKRSTGVCEKQTPFTRAFVLQHSGRNCSPAPDVVFFKQNFPRVFSGRSFFFTDRYGNRGRRLRAAGRERLLG